MTFCITLIDFNCLQDDVEQVMKLQYIVRYVSISILNNCKDLSLFISLKLIVRTMCLH